MGEHKPKEKKNKTGADFDLDDVVPKEQSGVTEIQLVEDHSYMVKFFSGHAPQEAGESSNYVKLLFENTQETRLLSVAGGNFHYENVGTVKADADSKVIIERVNRAKVDSPIFVMFKLIDMGVL